jgi:hypothetical protein
MKIIKKDTYGIIDSGEEERAKISYCPRCLKHGFHEVLGERIYLPNEPYSERDSEMFSQCRQCGTIVPKHEQKYESDLEESITTTDNPFDTTKGIIGIGNKLPKTKLQKDSKRIRDKVTKEKDLDVKRELKKGNQVTIHQYQ